MGELNMHGWSLFFMFASGKVGWLFHDQLLNSDFTEIHVFELWCCGYVFDWWEVIPTVSLGTG